MSVISATALAASLIASPAGCYKTLDVPTPRYGPPEVPIERLQEQRQRIVEYQMMVDIALEECSLVLPSMHRRVLDDRAYNAAVGFNAMVRELKARKHYQ